MAHFHYERIFAKALLQVDEVLTILGRRFERPRKLNQQCTKTVGIDERSNSVFEFLLVIRSRTPFVRERVKELGRELKPVVRTYALNPLLCCSGARRAVVGRVDFKASKYPAM